VHRKLVFTYQRYDHRHHGGASLRWGQLQTCTNINQPARGMLHGHNSLCRLKKTPAHVRMPTSTPLPVTTPAAHAQHTQPACMRCRTSQIRLEAFTYQRYSCGPSLQVSFEVSSKHNKQQLKTERQGARPQLTVWPNVEHSSTLQYTRPSAHRCQLSPLQLKHSTHSLHAFRTS
jgi:hypothetical protein